MRLRGLLTALSRPHAGAGGDARAPLPALRQVVSMVGRAAAVADRACALISVEEWTTFVIVRLAQPTPRRPSGTTEFATTSGPPTGTGAAPLEAFKLPLG